MLFKSDEQCPAVSGRLCFGDHTACKTLVVQLQLCAGNRGRDRVSPSIQWEAPGTSTHLGCSHYIQVPYQCYVILLAKYAR